MAQFVPSEQYGVKIVCMNRPNNNNRFPELFSVENVELKGFSRSVAELEWLLLILVLLYFVAPGTYIADGQVIVLAMVSFAAFVVAFRYLNFHTLESRWKLAIETWVMIAFITWVLLYTGKNESPLLNLYLLVIITSGLTLGKVTTLLEFALITCIYLYLGYPAFEGRSFELLDFTQIMIKFAPFLLVAYLITMLSADLHFARRMFEHLSETDEMTGLFNKRAFAKLSSREIAQAVRYAHSFSIVMIDADSLKQVNDQYGHETGDKLIRTLAESIRLNLRETDILARYGGDEFVVFLPETDSAQAREVAERVRDAVTSLKFMVHKSCVPITVSVGMASYPTDSNIPEEIEERADRALYYSKQEGRNRVTAFADIPMTSSAA